MTTDERLKAIEQRQDRIEQRLNEHDRAHFITASEQRHQSGDKPGLTAIIDRYKPTPEPLRVEVPA